MSVCASNGARRSVTDCEWTDPTPDTFPFVRISTLPGVFSPRPDTWMLAEALTRELRPGDEVLDLCTGSGALAVTAASFGAARTVAIDVSRRAVWTAGLNARRNGVRVDARRGRLFGPVEGEAFDLIVSNPPYVPAAEDEVPRRGARRAWDAGTDGRAVLDPLCDGVARHLRPGGTVLLVHSSLCGEAATIGRLEEAGLEVDVAVRHRGGFGPIVEERRALLERRGVLEPGQDTEDVVIIRGRRPVAGPPRDEGARFFREPERAGSGRGREPRLPA